MDELLWLVVRMESFFAGRVKDAHMVFHDAILCSKLEKEMGFV